MNPGSSPPTNFLILNCVASVLAPSPEEMRAARRCEDLCVSTVLQDATLPPSGRVLRFHCADGHPQARGRAEAHARGSSGSGLLSKGVALLFEAAQSSNWDWQDLHSCPS